MESRRYCTKLMASSYRKEKHIRTGFSTIWKNSFLSLSCCRKAST